MALELPGRWAHPGVVPMRAVEDDRIPNSPTPNDGPTSRDPVRPHDRVYESGERPGVEVLVHGHWLTGELRSWTQRDDGTWWGHVQYRPTDERILDHGTFPTEWIREAGTA